MGFLIGKSSNETLSNFETVKQNIKQNSFKNPERSINKSVQSYMFREKCEISFDFDYMTESNYRSLLYILNNRNSLHEGLLVLPLPYSDYSSTAILVSTYNTNNKCYKLIMHISYGKPWEKTWTLIAGYLTQLSESEYGYVDHYDTYSVSLPAVSTFYSGFILQYDLSNFVTQFSTTEIRRLTLSYIGMNTSPVRIFIYSPLHTTWYLIDDKFYFDDTQFSDSAFYLNKQIHAGFCIPWGMTSIKDDFMDASNIVKFMVVGYPNQSMILQYARLLVNGYWVVNTDPTDIENFANAFTGAGRSGQVKLMEM